MDVTHAISVVSVSDVGLVRALNEDAVSSDLHHGLVMLADGMGGYKSGEVASEMAVLVVTSELVGLLESEQAQASADVAAMFEAAVKRANDTIVSTSLEYAACKGMGTTFVGGVFFDNMVVVAHMGDSRMYRVRSGELLQLTEDHSVLQEQVNAGQIDKEDVKHSKDSHLVTRALGTEQVANVELNAYNTLVGDRYLLCSDGLTDLVGNEEINNTVSSTDGDMQLAAEQLVSLAKQYGGHDNISVLIAEVNGTFSR